MTEQSMDELYNCEGAVQYTEAGDTVLGLLHSDVLGMWADAEQRGAAVPERLLTIKEAAALAHCHEETIRRAYWANQLKVQPLGRRGKRIHPADLRDWMVRGMPTTMR